MPIHTEHDPRLKSVLKTRHISMLALGGVIGAGLFVGSSSVIASAGPAAFICYAITGIMVGLIMRMLGEMAAAHPTQGSFVDFSRMAFGNIAGFSTGWLYWYFWVVVVGFEAVVGGQIISEWLPNIPVWVISLTLLLIMTLLNLLSVSSFGEAEYWFAGIKVLAIIIFLVIVGAYVFKIWPNSNASFTNLTQHGGFLPYGTLALFSGIVSVIFSMSGVEVATIAAAESENPSQNIRRAVNTVMLRILIFFVLSTLFIVIAQPWTEITPGKSPFVSTLETIGIPGASTILTVVILIAVLSVLNAGLYTSSRLLHVLSEKNEAPSWLAKKNKRGVPVWGVIVSTLVGYGCVVVAALSPDTAFQFLLDSSGTIFLFIYLMICLSQLKLRKKWERESTLTFKMWLHPWLPLMVTACIITVLISIGLNPSTRLSLIQCLIAIIIIIASYGLMKLFKSSKAKNNSHIKSMR